MKQKLKLIAKLLKALNWLLAPWAKELLNKVVKLNRKWWQSQTCRWPSIQQVWSTSWKILKIQSCWCNSKAGNLESWGSWARYVLYEKRLLSRKISHCNRYCLLANRSLDLLHRWMLKILLQSPLHKILIGMGWIWR